MGLFYAFSTVLPVCRRAAVLKALYFCLCNENIRMQKQMNY